MHFHISGCHSHLLPSSSSGSSSFARSFGVVDGRPLGLWCSQQLLQQTDAANSSTYLHGTADSILQPTHSELPHLEKVGDKLFIGVYTNVLHRGRVSNSICPSSLHMLFILVLVCISLFYIACLKASLQDAVVSALTLGAMNNYLLTNEAVSKI